MMTEATVALIEYFHNTGLDKDVDLLREIVRIVTARPLWYNRQ